MGTVRSRAAPLPSTTGSPAPAFAQGMTSCPSLPSVVRLIPHPQTCSFLRPVSLLKDAYPSLAFLLPCHPSRWPCLGCAGRPIRSGWAWRPLCAQLMALQGAPSSRDRLPGLHPCLPPTSPRPRASCSLALCLIFLVCKKRLR